MPSSSPEVDYARPTRSSSGRRNQYDRRTRERPHQRPSGVWRTHRAVLDRFDVKIEFDLPDRDQLHAALAYYAGQLSPDDVAELVERLDGWNFRKIARFAEEVVRSYVSGLDLNLLEAGDPPLPRKEDYLAALAGFQ